MYANLTSWSVSSPDSYWSLGRDDVSPILNPKARAPFPVAACTVSAPPSETGEPLLLLASLCSRYQQNQTWSLSGTHTWASCKTICFLVRRTACCNEAGASAGVGESCDRDHSGSVAIQGLATAHDAAGGSFCVGPDLYVTHSHTACLRMQCTLQTSL